MASTGVQASWANAGALHAKTTSNSRLRLFIVASLPLECLCSPPCARLAIGSLEPHAHTADERPIGGELHAIYVLVDRQLQEAIHLPVLTERIARARAEEHELAAAVLGLRLIARVACPMQEGELQHEPEPLIEVPPVAEIEGHAPAGLELLMGVERLLHQDIAEPGRTRAEHAAEIAAEEQISRAASGLQRALGELAVRIAHIGLSGRQLQAE